MYVEEISELEKDVANNGTLGILIKSINVSYGKNISTGALDTEYEIVESDCNAYMDHNLHANNITKDSYIILREKNSNNINGYNKIYASEGNQDLIMSGNYSSDTTKILIKVLKGSITLDIKKDINSRSIEADFNNTCYGVYKNNILINKVCAIDNQITKIDNLEYGSYSVKQLKVGSGYIFDNNKYNVEINDSNKDVIVYLNNKVISNRVDIVYFQ